MVENVHQLRPKPSDSEKITINLGYVDLGQIVASIVVLGALHASPEVKAALADRMR
jgi:hypothetical protein